MNTEHEMSFISMHDNLPVGFDNSGESAGNMLLGSEYSARETAGNLLLGSEHSDGETVGRITGKSRRHSIFG